VFFFVAEERIAIYYHTHLLTDSLERIQHIAVGSRQKIILFPKFLFFFCFVLFRVLKPLSDITHMRDGRATIFR